MDASLPVAQALAVKDGRIVEVGGTDEVLWLREDDYEVIDLAGRTVVPGFVDPHNHFSIGAFETLWADCRAARSDRKSTRLNSSHGSISYAVFCLKKKKNNKTNTCRIKT